MCTLSVFKNGDDVIVTMNRDEQRNRHEENKIFTTDTLCFPIDKRSQGTWIGVNHHGIAVALLNRYQDAHRDYDVQSRGSIVPKLLSCATLNGTMKSLKDLSINSFNPFDCVVITRDRIAQATWDGSTLSILQKSTASPFFLSSSSERLEDVLHYRQNVFNDFSNQYTESKSSAGEILKDLHLKDGIDDESSSILMRRTHTHTKSITQINLSKNQADITYCSEEFLQDATQSENKHCHYLPAPCTSSEYFGHGS